MNTSLATVIAAVIVLMGAITSPFLIPNSPWINPQFYAEVVEYQSGDTKLSHITIQNIGWAQAKDAKTFIKLSESSLLSSNNCFEGEIEKSTLVDTYQITFDRMSTNVNCTLDFSSPMSQSVQNLVVTSSNSNGYEWDHESISLIDPTTSLEEEKIPEVTSQADFLLFFIISLTLASSITVVVGTLNNRRLKKNRLNTLN